MLESLRGRVVAIAGGATGIGAETARKLASEAALVVIGDRNLDGAEETADTVRRTHGDVVRTFRFDISEEEQVRAFVAFAVHEFGRLDGYFNNAADLSADVLGRDTDAVDIPTDVWQRTIDVNLSGYLYGIRYAVPALLESGGGSIVNTVSGAIYAAEPMRVGYAATKSAVTALSRNTAARYGKVGVRSNCVSPGFVLTEGAMRAAPQEAQDAILADLLLPRLGRPEDLASAVAFLMSDESSWITGQVIRVDGGYSFS